MNEHTTLSQDSEEEVAGRHSKSEALQELIVAAILGRKLAPTSLNDNTTMPSMAGLRY